MLILVLVNSERCCTFDWHEERRNNNSREQMLLATLSILLLYGLLFMFFPNYAGTVCVLFF